MTIEEYNVLFPAERVWCAFGDGARFDGHSEQGMLLFDDTADNLSGPFEGGYGYYRLHTPYTGSKLQTAAELRHHRRMRLGVGTYYGLGWGAPAANEAHLQKRLATLTARRRRELEGATEPIDIPTVDKPISFVIAGNDDSSYTKFYATLEEARAELNLFLADQPLNMGLHVLENGFVFTN